jgi:hypothetical protein
MARAWRILSGKTLIPVGLAWSAIVVAVALAAWGLRLEGKTGILEAKAATQEIKSADSMKMLILIDQRTSRMEGNLDVLLRRHR